jgi:hypothetical protein
LFLCGALSDERTGLSFVYAADTRQRSLLGPSPSGLVTIFYCLRFETSLFVASYDSQGHSGGIRPRLHAGHCNCCLNTPSHYITLAQTAQRTLLPTVTPLLCVTQPLPSNGCFSGSTVHALSKYATMCLPFGIVKCINEMKMGEADIFHFCILVMSAICCASDCHIVTHAVLHNVNWLWHCDGCY